MKVLNKSINPLLAIFVLCILTRLPQLLSPGLFLDSDESLVALMAKHLSYGKELPLFFWGQDYGFSLIEEIFMLPFIGIAGVSVIAVKCGMLLLWTIGIMFFYKMLMAINSQQQKLAFILTLLLMVSPAWALWSMKARGGYLTAFTLSTLTGYLLFNPKTAARNSTYIIAGILMYVIYESQPFFLSGLAPLAVYVLWKEKKVVKAAFMAMIPALLWLAMRYYKKGIDVYYKVDPVQLNSGTIFKHLKRIPQYLYHSLHGEYHFDYAFEPGLFTAAFAVVFTVLFFLLLAAVVVRLFRGGTNRWLFITACVFIPLTVAYSLLSESMQFRYLLPVTGYMLLAVYIYAGNTTLPRWQYVLSGLLIVIGTMGTASFYKSQYQRLERKPLLSAIKYLEDNDVRYVFCADYTMAWDVMFNSNERIIARGIHSPARYPKFDSLVDKAFKDGGKTAILGHADHRFNLYFSNYTFENSTYYITIYPDPGEIRKVFDFPETYTKAKK